MQVKKFNHALKSVAMELDMSNNVMMEMLLMAMDAAKIVKFRSNGLAQLAQHWLSQNVLNLFLTKL